MGADRALFAQRDELGQGVDMYTMRASDDTHIAESYSVVVTVIVVADNAIPFHAKRLFSLAICGCIRC